MQFLILFVLALLVSSIGFYKYIYFISIGYGFSIAAIGIALPIMFFDDLSVGTIIASLLFIVYGCRLGGYLLLRELKSAAYRQTMKTEIKDGKDMKIFVKCAIWVTCALLYVCQVSPVLFRLMNWEGTDACCIIGVIIMALGIALESLADYQKSQAKKINPKRFCDSGLYKIVRCPNYLGEVLFWTGVFISGVNVLEGVWQWLSAIFGYICIVYIMFGGARRLEIRQNKNYGSMEDYQKYVKTTPILIPFVPLYSVEKHKWLVG
ncbi:MAG: DUF1295 domain-containing protein [Lachnospiraceae bacterium]|nr:DUF1295 domain-containing protein [Lachnospiraceae bacterium]